MDATIARNARRVRWGAVAVLVVAWFVAVSIDLGGDAAHLLLVLAIALLGYELLAEDRK